jgi:hypothetical protein
VCDRDLARVLAGFFEKNFYWLLFTPPSLVAIRSFTDTRADPVATLLHVPVLLDPGCAGSSAAWPLIDAHRRLCLHTSSALFFQGKCCAYPFEKKKGAIFGVEE